MLRDKILQVSQGGSDAIGLEAEFLERHAGPIDPKARITKGLGAGSIPAAKGCEENLVTSEGERVNPHLIRARSGLKSLDFVGAGGRFEESVDPGVLYPRVEHRWSRI